MGCRPEEFVFQLEFDHAGGFGADLGEKELASGNVGGELRWGEVSGVQSGIFWSLSHCAACKRMSETVEVSARVAWRIVGGVSAGMGHLNTWLIGATMIRFRLTWTWFVFAAFSARFSRLMRIG